VKLWIKSVLLLWLAASGTVLAQTPDCPCPTTPPPDPLWFGKAAFSYLSTSGNTDTTSIGGGLELNYNPKPWLFTLKAGYLYGSTEGVVTAETFAASLRGARSLTERLDVFVTGNYLRNTFSGIDSLYGIDAGAGYKLFNGPSQFLRVEGAFGYTNEKDIVAGFAAPSRSYANARGSLNYKWQLTKTAAFTNDFTYLMDLSDTANWFITNKAAISVDISSIFALQASWTLFYRNQPVIRSLDPVTRYSNTDTATAVALVAKF
jgi:putative salt-induced outer membrane protein